MSVGMNNCDQTRLMVDIVSDAEMKEVEGEIGILGIYSQIHHPSSTSCSFVSHPSGPNLISSGMMYTT